MCYGPHRGPVHDQSPGGAVGAPVPAAGDHQPPLPTGILAPKVGAGAHQGPGVEIGKTWEGPVSKALSYHEWVLAKKFNLVES